MAILCRTAQDQSVVRCERKTRQCCSAHDQSVKVTSRFRTFKLAYRLHWLVTDFKEECVVLVAHARLTKV